MQERTRTQLQQSQLATEFSIHEVAGGVSTTDDMMAHPGR